MFIGKTALNKESLASIGNQLFKTKRTHKNDLVALHYMVDSVVNEYDALRSRGDFDTLITYTFCWALPSQTFHEYSDTELDIVIKQVFDDQHNRAYVCFFTGTIRQWCKYCKDESKPAPFREEVRGHLSQDGYSLIFKEAKKLK